jgi:two-component system sensor histidine kinase/response regulator
MSRELRTPLNGVIGILDLLLDSSDSPQRKRYASIARTSADLLLSVINQVLDFSKIEAGKLDLESIPFELRSVLEESLEMLTPKATQKELELTLDMPPELPTAVCGDPQRLRQVLVNLLGNAVKFTDQGQVRLRVRLTAETADRVVVCIAVVDSGMGIPAERLHRLFLSFSQIDTSTTRQFGGTGLGLAISKRLVELMGGQIGVESTLGRGSSFWFRVPLAKQQTPATSARLTSTALHGARVLVVDDNATNRASCFDGSRPGTYGWRWLPTAPAPWRSCNEPWPATKPLTWPSSTITCPAWTAASWPATLPPTNPCAAFRW